MYRERLGSRLAHVDRHPTQCAYVLGEHFSLADAYLFVWTVLPLGLCLWRRVLNRRLRGSRRSRSASNIRDDTYLGFWNTALWDEGAGAVISLCWLLLPLPGCPEGTKSSNPSIAMKTMPSSTMGPQAMPSPARSI